MVVLKTTKWGWGIRVRRECDATCILHTAAGVIPQEKLQNTVIVK